MSGDSPLLSSTTSRTPSVRITEPETDGLARSWPCRACGCLLGVLHLTFGVTIVILDTLTSHISGTAFSTTAALTYIISAVLCFIAARRLDRCAQLLLFGCSCFALVASLAIFLESGALLNKLCSPASPCHSRIYQIHVILTVISLSEGLTCVITLMVCYRSLRNAFGVSSAKSPYSTLIVGDYRKLSTQPKISNPRLIPRTQSAGVIA